VRGETVTNLVTETGPDGNDENDTEDEDDATDGSHGACLLSFFGQCPPDRRRASYRVVGR